MIVHTFHSNASRRGAIAVLVAIMMVGLMAIVALAVDLGHITVVRTQLQNAADASALAAADRLLDRDQLEGTPNQTQEQANARDTAVEYGRRNQGTGFDNLVFDRNDSNNPEGDVVLGFIADPSDRNSAMVYNVQPYNSVRVRARRMSGSLNSPLSLFFARVLGHETQGVEAEATATYDGLIQGFKINNTGPQNSKLMPFALDINVWNDISAGIGPDAWRYDPDTNAYSLGSDGIKEAKLYPLSNGSNGSGNAGDLPPGNFGTLDIGNENNSTADIERQILHGPNKSDFDKMGGQLKLGSDGTLKLQGDTGVSAGFKDALLSIRGQPRIIPLYRPPVTGTGNNAQYTIVGFAGIIVTEAVLTGSLASKHVTIQPEFCVDGSALGGATTTTSWFVYKGVSLSR